MKQESNNAQVKEPLGRIMGKIGRTLMANIHKSLPGVTIKRSYYPLLLIEAGKGRMTQNDLAGKLSCNKVQVVRIINYLSSAGYVERVPDPCDRRKYNLKVTEKAQAEIPDIRRALEKYTDKALTNIPEEKVQELYSLLHLIEKNLSN